MKKTKVLIILVMLLSLSGGHVAEAAKDPNRVTTWNKFTDFFATIGKDDGEKRRIRMDRRKRRQEARVFKANQKKQKRMRKQMSAQSESIMGKVKVRRVPHGRGGIDAGK